MESADRGILMASSSTLLSQINADFLTCLICMDTFKKPKVLNCQHSFCQGCLESCETSESGSYMSCPVCRQQTLLGMKGVNGLKDNFIFSNMIEMLETWNKSKCFRHKSTGSLQDSEMMCLTCPSTAPIMATFQCLDCLDHLCADCAAFHKRAKLTKGHEACKTKVAPIDEIENGLHEKKIRLSEMSRCSEHEIEMKHFCNECDIPVCKDCIVNDHQSHTLTPIEDEQNQRREKVSKIKLDLVASIQQMEELIEEISMTEKHKEQRYQHKKTEIRNRTEQFIEAIKKREKYLNDEVDRVQKDNNDKIKACRDGLEMQLKCLENCVQLSNSLLEDDSSFEILTMHRQIKATVKELEAKTEEVLSRNKGIMKSSTNIEITFGDTQNVCDNFGSLTEEQQEVEMKKNTTTHDKDQSEVKPKQKIVPTPAPRRYTAPENKPRHPRPRPVTVISPLIVELQKSESYSALTTPRRDKIRPLIRQNSAQNLSRSTESLASQGSLSPARLAPVPPIKDQTKVSGNPKKGKAPKPPALKPITQRPLPPPQNKKPTPRSTQVSLLKATRFVKFGKKGKILTNGEFAGAPKCVKFSRNKKKILVLDTENRHILVFSVEGFFKKSFNVEVPDENAYVGKTKIVQARPIDIAEAGRTHVLVLFKTFIVRWGWEGKLEHLWGSTELADANSITTDTKGRILVSDQEKHMIFVYDPYTREKIMQLGGFGDRNDLFKSPRYVCTNKYDDIIVSDHHNHCIKIFDKDGRFLFKFGGRGTEDGQLNYPEGVTTVRLEDESDGIMVADERNIRVSLFTSEGKFLSHVLTPSEDKGLKAPQNISVSCTGEEMIVRQINTMQVRVYKLNRV